MRLVKVATVSAIFFLFTAQISFAQTEKNKDPVGAVSCPAKIERDSDGRQGMKQLWVALRGCLSGGGFIEINDIKNSWSIDYRNDVSLIGGMRIADYEGDFLSLRIEDKKTSLDDSQDWSKTQSNGPLGEVARSELNISVKKNMESLTVVAIERDLEQLGFKKIAVVSGRPGTEIFIKNNGFTKVTVYCNEAVESAPEVISLTMDGYK